MLGLELPGDRYIGPRDAFSRVVQQSEIADHVDNREEPALRRDELDEFGGDPAEVARQVLFTDAQPETLAAIGRQPKQTPGSANAPVVGLLLGSPDFQRR